MGHIPGVAYPIDFETANWKDTGCQHFSSCLNCPFPVCKYDVPDTAKAMVTEFRDQGRLALIRENNWSVTEAADQLGVTIRTIFRIQSRAKESKPN